jgi:hypothetical protein
MDAGRDPSLIGKDQVAFALNTTFRGGFPRTRPYFVKHPITFLSEEERSWFETEIFQGMFFYSIQATPNTVVSNTNAGYLIFCVGGRLWRIKPRSFVAEEITPPDGRNSRVIPMAYFAQAEQWMIVQDGQSAPILWDGGNTRRAGLNEVPVGTHMAYGQGRLFVIVGNVLMAGDIVGGPGGPNAVINFTERLEKILNSDLSPSFVIGNPVFLEFIPQQDTATGVGTLLVGGEHGVTSIAAEKPRIEWRNGIARVVLFGIGGTGHRSPAQINGDIYWRAAEGLRSYRQARAQVTALAQLPLSTELDPFFMADTPQLLQFVSSEYFDNRLLMTVSPRWSNGRCWFGGLMSLDFNALSSFGKTITKPSYDGIWTGLNISEIRGGGGRCWMAGIDEVGRNSLYEVTLDEQVLVGDVNDELDVRRVRGQIVSGAYVTKELGSHSPKRLIGGKFTVRNVRERVDLGIDYKKDGEQCWQPWDGYSFCADTVLCTLQPSDEEPCERPFVANPQYRVPIVLRQPDALEAKSNNPPDGAGAFGASMVNGYEFQSRFRFEGNVQLRWLEMEFNPGYEKPVSGCVPTEDCSYSNVCCEDMWEFTPELPNYLIPLNPPDPKAVTLDAMQAIINYLGNGLLTPINDINDALPFPPEVINDGLVILINNGTLDHPSNPPGGGGGGGGFVRFIPLDRAH